MNSLKNLDQKLLLSSELDHFKISVRNVMHLQDIIILSSDLTSHGELWDTSGIDNKIDCDCFFWKR